MSENMSISISTLPFWNYFQVFPSILKFVLFTTMVEWLNSFNIRYRIKIYATEQLAYEWTILLIHYEVF